MIPFLCIIKLCTTPYIGIKKSFYESRIVIAEMRLTNPENVICRAPDHAYTVLQKVPTSTTIIPHSTIASPTTTQTHTKSNMPSSTLPRAALRCLSRTSPALRSQTPKVATRCIHQTAQPIPASSRHRPTVNQSSQRISIPSTVMARRTMFIQTEGTPNPDVSLRSSLQSEPY